MQAQRLFSALQVLYSISSVSESTISIQPPDSRGERSRAEM